MPRKRKKKKNMPGEGTLRVRESGTIEYRFPYKDMYGNSKRKSVSGLSEDECIIKAENFLREIKRSNQGADMSVTLVDILTTKYENDFKLNYIGAATCRRYLASLAHIKKTPIAKMPIAKIQKGHIDSYLLTLTKFANTNIRKYCKRSSKMHRFSPESAHFFSYSVLPVID